MGLRERWLEALRSGKYTQTSHQLRSGDGNAFCCLGVACDVKDSSKWEEGCYGPTHEFELLPETLKNELGLTDEQQSILTNMNDDQSCDFYQIADYLESIFKEKTS